MDASGLGWAIGGLIAGNIVLAVIWHWIRAIFEVLKTGEPAHRWRRVALTSLFNGGPWMIVAVGIFVYYEHSEPWAPWFLGGAAAWMALLGFLVAVTRRRVRGNRNAA